MNEDLDNLFYEEKLGVGNKTTLSSSSPKYAPGAVKRKIVSVLN